MADTVAKLNEALSDDLRMGEICLRALACEHQNGRGERCAERCGLDRGDVGALKPGEGFGGKVVISASLYRD